MTMARVLRRSQPRWSVVSVILITLIGCGENGTGGFAALERPRPVVANTSVNRGFISDHEMAVKVRNVGGPGTIRVNVTAYRDEKKIDRIDRWGTTIYLKKGEEKDVTIQMKGLSAAWSDVYFSTSAEAE